MNEIEEIFCLCPNCKKEILMIFKIRTLGIDVKELKVMDKKKK